MVQQTCKSWQDVTFKLQKALCRWEHAKSPFLSHNGHYFKSLYKREPLNPERRRSNAHIQTTTYLCYLIFLHIFILFTLCLSRSTLAVNLIFLNLIIFFFFFFFFI